MERVDFWTPIPTSIKGDPDPYINQRWPRSLHQSKGTPIPTSIKGDPDPYINQRGPRSLHQSKGTPDPYINQRGPRSLHQSKGTRSTLNPIIKRRSNRPSQPVWTRSTLLASFEPFLFIFDSFLDIFGPFLGQVFGGFTTYCRLGALKMVSEMGSVFDTIFGSFWRKSSLFGPFLGPVFGGFTTYCRLGALKMVSEMGSVFDAIFGSFTWFLMIPWDFWVLTLYL